MTRSPITSILITLAGLLLLIFVWSLFSRPVDSTARNFSAVRKSDFELRVDAIGILDAVRSEVFTSAMRGDNGKILQIAEDGTRVEKGDFLVRFDSTLLESELLRLTGELRSREAVSTYLKQAFEVEKSQVEKSLVHAEVDARTARQDFARHQAYIDDLEALGRRGIAVASEVAQAKRKAQQAQMQLEKAESDFERTKKEAVHRLAQSMAEVNKADSEAKNTLSSIGLTRGELGKTVLRASVRGFVVLTEISMGDQKRRLRVGDTVWQGQPILYIPDLSAMMVRSKVREEDLHKIREGQEATIRVEAYPEAVFKGHVTSIGALALEGASSNAAGKYFQMTVTMKGRDERLRPGMTARVAIVADRAKDVLVVPIPAIFYLGEQPVCFVAEGDKIISRPVRVGRRGDNVVEILAGLSEGERVSLVKP